MERKIKYKPNNVIACCPKCGNNTHFTIKSEQCAEDCCEIWAVCKCGYDPTDYEQLGSGHRLEDVWGDIGDLSNISSIICYTWTEALKEAKF